MERQPRARFDFTAAMPALERLCRDLYGELPVPEVALVRQRLDTPRLDDIEGAVVAAVRRVAGATDRRGPIAGGVGSRGNANPRHDVRTAINEPRAPGLQPLLL